MWPAGRGFNRTGRVTAVTDGAGLADGAVGLDDRRRAAGGAALVAGCGRRSSLRRAFVAPVGLQRLSLFADRTLAPATAESRARGAGGGDDSLS